MVCYSQDDIVISIFSIPVFVQYQIPEIMSAFRALHPQVKFNVVESESSLVLQGLRRLECDFAILRTDFLDEEQYNITPINVDRLVAVVPELSLIHIYTISMEDADPNCINSKACR